MESVQVQNTLIRSVTFTGVGLHSGAPVTMTVHPAAEDHGICFRRTDVVTGDAQVFGDAVVSGYSHVFGDARVSGYSLVSGYAQVSGIEENKQGGH